MRVKETFLVINCGSSSIKFALFADEENAPTRLWSGALQRIGLPDSRFRAEADGNGARIDETHDIPNHIVALDLLLSNVEKFEPDSQIKAVGHRVVHGGDECDCSLVVTAELEARLRKLIPLAALHLPHNLAGITAVRLRHPGILQVAAFDTAFHQRLPRLARLTGLPHRFEKTGIRRYGFHGLSYEYVVDDLRQRHGDIVANGRIIVAHLGNGASMAAIHRGHSVETTMGFSTLGGLPMGTRSGDLDPGIVLYLLMEKGMTAEDVQALLYRESGLLGLSGISRNMEKLLTKSEAQAGAAEAVEFFCYQARKHLAALTTTLGGLDHIVFTGGIGANAPAVRAKICEGLDYLGVEIDERLNESKERKISSDRSAVLIEAVPTDEELMIARHVQRLITEWPMAQGA